MDALPLRAPAREEILDELADALLAMNAILVVVSESGQSCSTLAKNVQAIASSIESVVHDLCH